MTIPVLHAPFDRPRLSSEACAMLEAAFAEPNEVLHRHSLADWLTEHEMPLQAQWVRRTIPEQPLGHWLPILPSQVYLSPPGYALDSVQGNHWWPYDDPWQSFCPPSTLVRFTTTELFGDKRPPVNSPINAIGSDGQRRIVLWNVRMERLLQQFDSGLFTQSWPRQGWMACQCCF